MRRFFHEDLSDIEGDLISMSEKAYESVSLALAGLENRDTDLSRKVLEADEAIDSLELKLDHGSTRYIALHHPVAKELRLIAVAIKVSQDLERVGDEATTIAKRTIHLCEEFRSLFSRFDPALLLEMGDTCVAMLRNAIDSFLNQNTEAAIAVVQSDHAVDGLNKENLATFTRLLEEHPRDASGILDLIFISKSLERIADHATNIAEEVVFLVSGSEVRHSGLKRGRKGAIQQIGLTG